jgi:hypothetical protein
MADEMEWVIELSPEFDAWFRELTDDRRRSSSPSIC